jgi:hypothetical protein
MRSPNLATNAQYVPTDIRSDVEEETVQGSRRTLAHRVKGMQTRGGNRMFSTLRFIGKWTQWYCVLRRRMDLDLFIPCGMGSGWLAAEHEDDHVSNGSPERTHGCASAFA